MASRIRLWVAAFALLSLLLSVQPAASATPRVIVPPGIPEPPMPREQPICILADGNATLRFRNVTVPASLFLAGKLQRNPWLPLIRRLEPRPVSGWIRVEVLTVKVGEKQFSFSGYGIVMNGRVTVVGWSRNASVLIQGAVLGSGAALNGPIRLRGTLVARSPGSLKPEAWWLSLQGLISGEPPVQPLK